MWGRMNKRMIHKQEKMRHWMWRMLTVVLTAVLLPFTPLQQTQAADTDVEKVNIQVTYGQTEARKMVDEFNAYRTAPAVTGSAVYDYGLEKCAMQRAAELALTYHMGTRPDGSRTDSIYGEVLPGFTGTDKEMVLCYEETAKQVADAWVQAGLDDVLTSEDRYIGASRVSYNNHYYWVVICSDTPTGTILTGAYDGAEIRSVSILSSQITERVIHNCPTGTINLYVGEYYDLSKCSASIKVAAHDRLEDCPLAGGVSAVATDSSVVSFNGTSLYAAKAGSTNVSITCGGLAASPVAVVVQQPTFSQATIDTIPDQSYTGYEIRPTVRVRIGNKVLTENVDYTLKYENNINIGTAFVTVTGYGTYVNTGSKSIFFRIIAPTVANATITSISDQSYTGYAICPAVTVFVNNVLLREGTDYTVSYSNNVNIGTASVTITGIGTYSGTKTVTFRITGPSLYSATIAAIPDQLYTGSDIRPELTVTVNNTTLRQNTDYYVSYSNNRNVGTATVTVTGRGNYTGTKTSTFRIIGKDLSNTKVSSIDTQRYTGEEIRPAVTVKIGSVTLQRNVDYTLTYRDNIRPGTASILITGAGSYRGSKTVTFKIAQASLSSAIVKVSDQTYNGTAKTPRVLVRVGTDTLKEDVDYELEYRNNKNPGKATVVLTGIGDYSGTKKAYFVIAPKKMTWISVKAVTNTRGKAVALSWRGDRYASGYELHCSEKKSSGYKRIGTISKNIYTRCTHERRPRGNYYYKVRSYILVDGKKYYSAFSNVKGVRVK